jgi:hypothetical protein
MLREMRFKNDPSNVSPARIAAARRAATEASIMPQADAPTGIQPKEERRSRLRLKVTPRGDYVLENGIEGQCTVIDASSDAMAISADQQGHIGDTVIVHLREIGSIDGTIVRLLNRGFVIAYTDEPRSAEAVTRLVEWLRGLN